MAGSLSAAEVAHFEEHGYLFPKRAIGAAEAERYRLLLEHYETVLGVEPQTYLKIKAHVAAPWIVDLARSESILDAVESLIGENILLFGTSLFSKKGNDPRFVSWHQDSAYYGLDPHEEVTAWVALTPATRSNGCMRVMPGSHRGPDLDHDETYDPQNLLARGQTIHGLEDDKAVFMELEAGEFSLHHERTAHGSLANETDGPRVGVAYFYIPAHCRSTIGRRTALPMRGEDRYGHWDADPLPKQDLDPRLHGLPQGDVGPLPGHRGRAGGKTDRRLRRLRAGSAGPPHSRGPRCGRRRCLPSPSRWPRERLGK